MTDELLSTVFGTKVDSTMLTEGGYVAPGSEAGYWAPSGTTALDSAHFFLPISFTDPFSNTTTLAYDSYKFLVTSVTDALSNEVQAIYDYRLMTPTETIDPNLNHSKTAFDELGRVIAMALQGKSSAVGDTLANPTVSYEYELDRWSSSSLPNRVHVKAREQHYSDSTSTRFQESYTYSDGSGRVVMTKTKVDPGDAPALDGSGNLITVSADPRWVGSGKTVVNNKGNPVKQYEPFFSDTEEYQSEDAIVKWGVTPVFTYDALGRAKRIDLPNGTFRESEWDAWSFTASDENDTLGDGNIWYEARKSTATPTPSAREQRAAAKAVLHTKTPTTSHYDTMGRPFFVQAMLAVGTPPATVDTRSALDIESQVTSVTDALGRTCETRDYAIGGTLLKTLNLDQGTRWMLDDVTGKPIRHWDSRGQIFRTVYDALRRPTHAYVTQGSSTEILLQRHYFGEAASSPTTHNLLGKAIAVYDGAGKVETADYDFKGNLLSGTRTLTSVYNATPDWSALASITDPATAATTAATQLETETWATSTTFDALNRPITSTSPDTSVSTYGYGQSAMLKTVDVNVRGAGTATSFVSDIEYDAKGQRQSIDYGNGTSTAYTYDPLTFRLVELKTTRTSDSAIVQDLTYTFDPVGNVVEIDDGAQQTVYFANTVTDGTQLFEYDPLYRLVHAEGREHAGNVQINDASDVVASTTIPHVNDASAVKPYQEDYTYDVLGNITELAHTMTGSSAGSWTRTYTYCYQLTSGTDTTSIRLASNTWDSHSDATYTYDEHGSTLSMPHLAAIEYSPFDQMMHAEAGSQDAYYQYDASGQRARKMVDTGSGVLKERVYVGGYEVYREISLGTVQLERQTLHVMDGVRRIAMVETKTNDSGPVTTPVPRTRYQLTNHLDSAMAELDDSGNVFSYEEYHPYGTTAYRSGLNGLDVSAKRYRYCGAEKDDETGFYCMGMRYYCPWLTRWTTSDPLGLQAGINVYLYCRAGPMTFSDPSGLEPEGVPGFEPPVSFVRPPSTRKTKLHSELQAIADSARKHVAQLGLKSDFMDLPVFYEYGGEHHNSGGKTQSQDYYRPRGEEIGLRRGDWESIPEEIRRDTPGGFLDVLVHESIHAFEDIKHFALDANEANLTGKSRDEVATQLAAQGVSLTRHQVQNVAHELLAHQGERFFSVYRDTAIGLATDPDLSYDRFKQYARSYEIRENDRQVPSYFDDPVKGLTLTGGRPGGGAAPKVADVQLSPDLADEYRTELLGLKGQAFDDFSTLLNSEYGQKLPAQRRDQLFEYLRQYQSNLTSYSYQPRDL